VLQTPRQIVTHGLLLGLLLTLLAASGFLGVVHWYSQTDRLLPGVTVGLARIGGMRLQEARSYLEEAAASDQRLQAPLALRYSNQVWELPQLQLAAAPDLDATLRQAAALGRRGSLWMRAKEFLVGLVHGHYLPLKVDVKEGALLAHLERVAEEVERPPQDARYDISLAQFTDEVFGLELDKEASLEAVRAALDAGRPEANLVVRPVAPAVRKADVPDGDWYQIARFTTPILAAEPGRVKNIALAAEKISGQVVRPGQIFSFNEAVGPRDPAYGWAQAREIYQGEYVLGYGGGICQVSSTLYNAVLLAGLEVMERYHHERPLQYVDPGRDATVVWNVLDFKFRNNTEQPLVMTARILPGSPQQLEVALHSPEPLPTPVRVEEDDLRYYPPEMEEELDPTLPANQRKVVDEGHYGLEVKVYRVYGSGRGERRELVSHDRYLPKPGKVRVGVGNAPGSEKLLNPGIH